MSVNVKLPRKIRTINCGSFNLLIRLSSKKQDVKETRALKSRNTRVSTVKGYWLSLLISLNHYERNMIRNMSCCIIKVCTSSVKHKQTVRCMTTEDIPGTTNRFVVLRGVMTS